MTENIVPAEDVPIDNSPRPDDERDQDRPSEADSLRFTLGYRPELDSLRATAVIMVMFYHGFWFISTFAVEHFASFFISVDIFFISSGFLLTSLLFEEKHRNGKVSFKGFYKRRALRLIPSLVFVLSCHLIYVVITGRSLRNEFIAITIIVTYVANYASAYMRKDILLFSFDQTWTLSVEEQYYLFFFPLLLLVHRFVTRFRSLFIVLAVGIVLAAGWRFYLAMATSVPSQTLYLRTDTRLDILLLGPAAAVLLQCGLRRARWVNAAALVSLVGLIWFLIIGSIHDRWVYQWGYPLIALAITTIVVWFVSGPDTPIHRMIRVRPAVWIGKVSYELYLVHLPIFLALANAGLEGPVGFAVAFTASFAAAAFTYHFVARPFMKRKHQQALALRGSARPV